MKRRRALLQVHFSPGSLHHNEGIWWYLSVAWMLPPVSLSDCPTVALISYLSKHGLRLCPLPSSQTCSATSTLLNTSSEVLSILQDSWLCLFPCALQGFARHVISCWVTTSPWWGRIDIHKGFKMLPEGGGGGINRNIRNGNCCIYVLHVPPWPESCSVVDI